MGCVANNEKIEKSVIAFADQVGDDIQPLFDEAFTQIIAIIEADCDFENVLENGQKNLEFTFIQIFLNGYHLYD